MIYWTCRWDDENATVLNSPVLQRYFKLSFLLNFNKYLVLNILFHSLILLSQFRWLWSPLVCPIYPLLGVLKHTLCLRDISSSFSYLVNCIRFLYWIFSCNNEHRLVGFLFKTTESPQCSPLFTVVYKKMQVCWRAKCTCIVVTLTMNCYVPHLVYGKFRIYKSITIVYQSEKVLKQKVV